ncbi:Csu type fimbrial protein [Brucella sp. 22210]|uniref:Csu type fimbrial protein n=1 Tax=Brucella sp. 22210 TaxID=3453892 RepID=UPI003F8504B1
MRFYRIVACALFNILIFLPSWAHAQTCSFSITNVNFGTVNLLGGGAVDTTATLGVNCSNTLTVSLFLRVCPNINAGSGGSSGGLRTMLSGTNALTYQLYSDTARSVPWGSVTNTALGSPPPIDMTLLPLTSTTATRTIYGRILSGQAATPGGAYLSTFSGAQTRFNYASYLLVAPACTAMTDNPTQPTFNVTANVDRTCTVSATSINFGNHGVLTSNVDATGALSVSCTTNLPYSVSLNGGLSNTTPTQRRMTLGSNAVIYGLYTNAARSIPWGNTTGQIVTGTGTGTAQSLTVYGRVAPQTTPPPGTYSDTVVVTVSY